MLIICLKFTNLRSALTKTDIVNSQMLKSEKEKEKEKEQTFEPSKHSLLFQESEQEVESDDEK